MPPENRRAGRSPNTTTPPSSVQVCLVFAPWSILLSSMCPTYKGQRTVDQGLGLYWNFRIACLQGCGVPLHACPGMTVSHFLPLSHSMELIACSRTPSQ